MFAHCTSQQILTLLFCYKGSATASLKNMEWIGDLHYYIKAVQPGLLLMLLVILSSIGKCIVFMIINESMSTARGL